VTRANGKHHTTKVSPAATKTKAAQRAEEKANQQLEAKLREALNNQPPAEVVERAKAAFQPR
jgi:hypothetical protein